ncbi:MAG: 2-hydroxyacyl-CoA dehydratase family protein [Chloroflexota bacterium]|nr:2-hydroxyacyl-CoA dehydratase family protein [Chloroflexota bacterium]
MTIERMNNKIDSIIRACRLIRKMNQSGPNARKSDILYYNMLEGYYKRLLSAHDNNNLIAAHTDFFPVELLYAMDIVPMHTEVTTWMIVLFTGEIENILASGSELGLVSEICTPHRGIAGAYANGVVPRPDMMLWSNLVCDNTAKSGELIVEITGSKGYFLDYPFKSSASEMDYLVAELGDLVGFLERQSGRKMDWDRLSHIVGQMNVQIELMRQINELRKAVPTPFSPLGFLQLITADYLCPGQPEAIAYLETLRDELSQMVEAGEGAVSNERFRLMSFWLPPMHMMGFLDRIAEEFGAVSVTEPFFTFWGEGELDPGKPLESVARKSYIIPAMRMFGPMDERAIGSIVDCVEQYRVNGAVYYANIGCRHTCATIKLFKDVLADVDVPMLTIDCDVVDPTVTSEDEVRGKLEQFFEMLEDR